MKPTTGTRTARAMNRPLAAAAALMVVALAGAAAAGDSPVPTSTSGPSLLSKWGREMRTSALGRMGHLGSEPEGASHVDSSGAPGEWLREGFPMDGEDLYRYNCRSCHGMGGEGLPPEIRPLTGQAELLTHDSGAAEDSLRHRLAEGGSLMPAFGHFSPDEVEALLAYIDSLAAEPGAGAAPITLVRSADRVGEHLVRGTCQVCHDATKPPAFRPGSDKDIPPLATFTKEQSLDDFRRTARHLDVGSEESRGRGPRFRYLSDDELVAAYLYLAIYPPE